MAQGRKSNKNRLQMLRDSIQENIDEFNEENEKDYTLNFKQKKAVHYLLRGENKKNALKLAGYSESYQNSAANFFAQDNIKQYMVDIRQEIEDQSILSIQDLEHELFGLYQKVKKADDTDMQLKVLKMIFEYKQMMSPTPINQNNQLININLNLVKPDEDEEDNNDIIEIS